ncbi:hypothetical protein BH11MYX2_BH11MYX2_26660 [soil metagenome]
MLREYLHRAVGRGPRWRAVPEPVTHADEEPVVPAEHACVVAAAWLTSIRPAEHADLAPSRCAGLEEPRTNARSFLEPDVEVHLVGMLAGGREANTEASCYAWSALECARRVGNAVAFVGGDDLDAAVRAARDRSHRDLATPRMLQLVVRELTRDRRQTLGKRRAHPLRGRDLSRLLPDGRDRRIVSDRDRLRVAEPLVD